MSLTRRQIGAAWSIGNDASSTTIQLPSRTIRRGSLVKAFFRYESGNVGLTVTDSAGGVWRVERHFQTNINVAIAWCWNHPGGANVVITGTLESSQSYRYASAVEETGGDVVDPFIPESVIRTYGGTEEGLRHWVASDPFADTVHASGSYNSTVFAALPEQTVIHSASYLYSTSIRGINSTRRFAHHFVPSGLSSSIAHLSMAFRAPEAEYVALAKRRIWVPVSTGGGGAQTLSPSLLTRSKTIYESTVIPGVVTVSPGLLTRSKTIYAPTVAQGGVTLSPPLLTRAKVLYAPSLSVGSVSLAPLLLTRSKTLYAPVVSQAGAPQIVAPGLLTRTKVLYAPVVVPGEVDVAPPLLTRSKVLYSPTLSTDYGITAPLLIRSKTIYAPTITVGGVTLTPPLLTRSKTLYFPTLTGGDAPVATGGVFWPTVRRRRR